MTNVPDPDDYTADERVPDDPPTETHLDAAIRELDPFRRREAWSTATGTMTDDVADSLRANLGHTAGEIEPSPTDEAAPLLEDRLPFADSVSRAQGDSAMASPAGEPLPPATGDVASEPEPSSLPHRMFGLRRALDAHRLGVSVDDLPTGPVPAEPEIVSTATSQPVSGAPQTQTPEPEPGRAAGPGAPAERDGSFGRRHDAEPEANPGDRGKEVVATAGGAALAASVATAAVTETERRGLLGSRSTTVTVTRTAAPPGPDKIDLEPVREAMQAVADTRSEAPAGDAAILTEAAAGNSSESQSADVARVGVLLVNLGTPDAPTPKAVRRYLREFLSDRRVIEKDTFVWQLVFKGIILPFRPRSKARAYKSIWNQETNESPLKTITRAQAEKLDASLADAGVGVAVDWAMRYGNPSIESRIKALLAQGCERILLVPLYPQYSSATTATVCDEAFRVVSRLRNQPSLRVTPPYYDDPVYIEAIASSIRAELAKLSFEPEVIIASYHGMPLEYVQKGDPYLRHCTRTTELLRERFGQTQSDVMMTFQSRFGRAEWLQPYTDQTLRKLAKDGVRSVAVVTPGFAADCLETLEEIAVENAHFFRKKGGRNFAFIPCLNDSERGMLVIREIARRELSGWV